MPAENKQSDSDTLADALSLSIKPLNKPLIVNPIASTTDPDIPEDSQKKTKTTSGKSVESKTDVIGLALDLSLQGVQYDIHKPNTCPMISKNINQKNNNTRQILLEFIMKLYKQERETLVQFLRKQIEDTNQQLKDALDKKCEDSNNTDLETNLKECKQKLEECTNKQPIPCDTNEKDKEIIQLKTDLDNLHKDIGKNIEERKVQLNEIYERVTKDGVVNESVKTSFSDMNTTLTEDTLKKAKSELISYLETQIKSLQSETETKTQQNQELTSQIKHLNDIQLESFEKGKPLF